MDIGPPLNSRFMEIGPHEVIVRRPDFTISTGFCINRLAFEVKTKAERGRDICSCR